METEKLFRLAIFLPPPSIYLPLIFPFTFIFFSAASPSLALSIFLSQSLSKLIINLAACAAVEVKAMRTIIGTVCLAGLLSWRFDFMGQAQYLHKLMI